MSPKFHPFPILISQSPTESPPNVNTYDYGYEQDNNINDIIEQREWEVRNQGNWSDVEGEEFLREYMNLPPQPPPPSRRGSHFRPRGPALNPPLPKNSPPPHVGHTSKKPNGMKTRAKWSDQDLKDAISCLDIGYTIKEVCEAFSILRTSLRDHYEGRVKGRKMGPKSILTKEEEENLVAYMMEMISLAHSLSVDDLKMKVAEICQDRQIPFGDGIPGKSWLKWFKHRHPQLVMRIPQGLDLNRARNLCPPMVESFYENLQNLYNQSGYQLSNIWNVDESGANASRNGVGMVFASRRTRNVHTITPNEREWISVLTSINVNGETIPNYYIFKGMRSARDHVALCENGATFGMQKRG